MRISRILLVVDMILMLYYTITGAQLMATMLIILIPTIMNIDD